MKMTLNLAAAAVALAVSGAASAAVGDIFVDIFDSKSGDSFVVDTGAALGATSSTPIDVTTLANWGSFASAVTAAGGTLAGLQFTAIASTGTTRSGSAEVTFNGAAPATISSFAGVQGAAANWNTVTSAGLLVPSTGGTSWGTLVGASGNYGGFLATGNAVGPQGTAMTLYTISTAGATTATTANIDLTFTGTTSNLVIGTVGAVPEPGTYAMMFAGLLAVGAIVRRRTRA